jgi:arylsulfatase A-like enzyme
VSIAHSAICLVIDRLSSHYLGALGNTWIRTPEFDRLAAQSLIFDRAMTDSPSPDNVYQSFWASTAKKSLPDWCRSQGVPTLLVTDDGRRAAHSLAAEFDEVVHIAQTDAREQANDWHETQLAAFFAAAVELLDARRPPALIWLHSGALGRIWDSPQPFRDQYAAEDDPPAPPLVDPPSLLLDGQADPDMLLGLRHAYAGEVSVLDHCIGMLLETIDAGRWQDALFCLTSCRGYPLGEHGIVGDAGEALYAELVRVPLWLRFPGGPKYGIHSQALVQPADFHATLLTWFSAGGQLEQLSNSSRTLAIARSQTGEVALATPAWFVRAPALGQDPDRATERRIELFAQPDDYFQVNEVSDRCLEVVDEFRQVLQAVESAGADGDKLELTLSDALLHGVESQSS